MHDPPAWPGRILRPARDAGFLLRPWGAAHRPNANGFGCSAAVDLGCEPAIADGQRFGPAGSRSVIPKPHWILSPGCTTERRIQHDNTHGNFCCGVAITISW